MALRDDFPVLPVLDDKESSPGLFIDRLERGIFTHLNEEKDLGREFPDWRLGPQKAYRLWTITLHYHQWAYDLAKVVAQEWPKADAAATLFKHYVMDWIIRCDVSQPGARDLAWNSYAVSTRIAWWVRSYQTIPKEWWLCNPDFLNCFLKSMWRQAAYLNTHLEYDLRANHLMRDTVGLALAGRFFSGPLPQTWLNTATRLALDQIEEQVLPDGGHFERSPIYHLHIMEDLLNLTILVEDCRTREEISHAWRNMAECLIWLRHPDSQIPLLNDAALNGACHPDLMLAQTELTDSEIDISLPAGGRLFPDFGLFVWHGDPWSVFFDVGPIGVDYQPGHAHADTLTAELSFRGQRLFVDPGTLHYDLSERRRVRPLDSSA